MGRLSALVVGFALGAGAVGGSLNYHVLKTAQGYEFVPKSSMTFEETYTDVREFGPADWVKHPLLSQALIKADKQHVFKDAAVGKMVESVNEMLNDLR